MYGFAIAKIPAAMSPPITHVIKATGNNFLARSLTEALTTRQRGAERARYGTGRESRACLQRFCSALL